VSEEARKHSSDRDLVDLTPVVTVTNVWNRLAVGFRQGTAARQLAW
jgi:alkylhydroperoxidase family enzyme